MIDTEAFDEYIKNVMNIQIKTMDVNLQLWSNYWSILQTALAEYYMMRNMLWTGIITKVIK